jgi:hypothetical protein
MRCPPHRSRSAARSAPNSAACTTAPSRAILLAQFARADGSPGIGEEMLQHANRTAQRALPYVGATVLVVDPFDSDTAEMWRQRFGFQDSEQPVPGDRALRRQWLSLQS